MKSELTSQPPRDYTAIRAFASGPPTSAPFPSVGAFINAFPCETDFVSTIQKQLIESEHTEFLRLCEKNQHAYMDFMNSFFTDLHILDEHLSREAMAIYSLVVDCDNLDHEQFSSHLATFTSLKDTGRLCRPVNVFMDILPQQ